MKLPVYTTEGAKKEELEVSETVFNVPLNHDLVHQAVTYYRSNARQVSAHTKTRGEVAGGGKKPWAQKHTGRARHGSIRSPLWIGGGVTFGPRNERVFAKDINKKMRRKALAAALSQKAKENLVIVTEDFNLGAAKTKELKKIMEKLPCESKSSLVALPAMDKAVIAAGRNLENVQTIQARDLNALEVLSFKYLILPKTAVKVLEEMFVKSKKS
ncbi:MAG: 50S ribosomal protein L4 [Candidatus Wildermuthbacteria bacterium]|nr:50S ribosomal protein L4 [Candidatus Wildermuthbacteria bacterium]